MNKNTIQAASIISRFAVVCCMLGMLIQGSIAEMTAYADDGDNDKIRVGFFEFSGYHEIDDDGTRTGYGYEFFQKISILDDWTFEYIGYDRSYSDNLEMLLNGELDIVTSVSKTPEREKMFLFSEEPIGTNSTIFTVKEGNVDVIAGDYSTYNGLKVGMLKNNSKNENFDNFTNSHDFSYTPVYYATEDELTHALHEDEVDGIVSGSLRKLNQEWLIESMNESDYYVVVNKDNPQLMERMVMVLFVSLFAIICVILLIRTHSQKILKLKIQEVSQKYETKEKELSKALAIVGVRCIACAVSFASVIGVEADIGSAVHTAVDLRTVCDRLV